MSCETIEKLPFSSDYMEGAHPAVMAALNETNLLHSPGYGEDAFSETARDMIRNACAAPGAAVHFLVGGTQANAVVIGALLRPYQGVLAAKSGHISVHEAGAVERGGHKVLALPSEDGKLTAEAVQRAVDAYRGDENREHTVMPGMVYISQPTELGTLYSLAEMQALSDTCRAAGMPLYLDGARLAYALACPENDVTLADVAALCDVFYIGGTKCGALFGEAVVIPEPALIPHFFTIVKQHGALLAKGRILGVQFAALFGDGLYGRIGAPAIRAARRIRAALLDAGYELYLDSPTNQLFIVMDNERLRVLKEQIELSFIERLDASRSVMRLVTSWATADADVDALIEILRA